MFFLIELGVSVFYAFAALVVGWSGVALLACAAIGALLRLRFDRESAIFLGSIAVGLILLADSVAIGFEVAAEVARGGDDPLSPHTILLLPFVAWLIHLPMGLWVLRLGITGLERCARRLSRQLPA